MSTTSVRFGPRLVTQPTANLRAALVVRPSIAIADAKPLQGEPSAICARALNQHDVLVRTLNYCGVETIVLDGNSVKSDPLDCAVANAAVVFEDGAFMMRPTEMARRGAVENLETEFTRIDVPLAGHIVAPGLLDGGDILLAGEVAFVGVRAANGGIGANVGLGSHGNAIGRNGFSQVARAHGYRVVEVPMRAGVPSLRLVAGALARDTIVASTDSVDVAAFKNEGFKIVALERGEDLAAGVLTLGERHVLADVRYPTALARMRKAGVTVEAIDLYDFMKVGITPSLLALALKRD
jgi:N-dimethylarginine dimethylaminohydrolase